MKVSAKQLLISSDVGQFSGHSLVEFKSVPRRGIAQAVVLQPAPEWLDPVEHRCIKRQSFQGNPIGVDLLRLTNRISFVHRPSVPDDIESTWQRYEQCIKGGRNIPGVEEVIDQGLKVKFESVPVCPDPYRLGVDQTIYGGLDVNGSICRILSIEREEASTDGEEGGN